MNFQELIKQAQKQMEKVQQQMRDLVVEASSGGGIVTVTMDGTKQLLSIKIEPQAVSANDIPMLEDMILAAISDAYRKVDEALASKLGPFARGLKIPGLF